MTSEKSLRMLADIQEEIEDFLEKVQTQPERISGTKAYIIKQLELMRNTLITLGEEAFELAKFLKNAHMKEKREAVMKEIQKLEMEAQKVSTSLTGWKNCWNEQSGRSSASGSPESLQFKSPGPVATGSSRKWSSSTSVLFGTSDGQLETPQVNNFQNSLRFNPTTSAWKRQIEPTIPRSKRFCRDSASSTDSKNCGCTECRGIWFPGLGASNTSASKFQTCYDKNSYDGASEATNQSQTSSDVSPRSNVSSRLESETLEDQQILPDRPPSNGSSTSSSPSFYTALSQQSESGVSINSSLSGGSSVYLTPMSNWSDVSETSGYFTDSAF